MKTTLFSAALAVAAGAALAAGADFAQLDADGSGALSLAELNARMADVTAEDFAAIDADGSGDISEAEYAAWKQAKPKKDPARPQ